tara:strand:+ start:223 stop:468 length:246 start_codon:yes stop_codon:yes gene_type:complete
MTPDTLKINWTHTFKRSMHDNQKIAQIEKKHNRARFGVRKCPVCSNAWEKIIESGKGHKDWKTLPDFPKYGLKEEKCPDHS